MPIEGPVTRAKIDRTDDFSQAGERWRSYDERYRMSVVRNLGDELKKVEDRKVVDAMIDLFERCDAEMAKLIRRRSEGKLEELGKTATEQLASTAH
jgi:catalase